MRFSPTPNPRAKGHRPLDFYATQISFLLGPFLSYPLRHTAAMKLNPFTWLKHNEGKIMAHFGKARLVKQPTGKSELIGGTPKDRAAAREWCSLFLHEAIIH